MTFLFDIGRVLLDFDFESSLSRLFPPGTPDTTARLRRLLDRKDEFESGRIDVDSYTAWALEVLETDATPEEFHHAWRDIFTPNEPMWRHVREFSAAGHRLILFSNINGIHVPWIYDEFPEFHLFDDAVMSFQTGFIKPQPEIYHHAIRQHGLVPAETLYIDDLPQNAAAGRAIGFHTWEYDLKDHASFEDWLGSFPI
jgi:putative hydrolase of the HAD superfamily